MVLTLNERKSRLIDTAKYISGDIYPCYDNEKLEDCFTDEWTDNIIFWWNDSGKSTHIVRENTTRADIEKQRQKRLSTQPKKSEFSHTKKIIASIDKDSCPECELTKYYCNCHNINN